MSREVMIRKLMIWLLRTESILNPEVPLALRLSGQLLLGVVNIYKKKVLYLFEDCNDAISKMQQVCTPMINILHTWHGSLEFLTRPAESGSLISPA